MSVVAAGPQAYFGYVEQASFVMHPAPLVVQVGIIALQSSSVINLADSKAQVKGIHFFEAASQAQDIFVDPSSGVLLHSY